MNRGLRVGIVMGSDSDLEVMRHVGRALTGLGLETAVDYEERVLSVHRTTDRAMDYARTAEERGLLVIVAGAGGSAHLPGMVASETVVPVLGVAITRSPDTLNRALGSMIGMPEGKPLATFQAEAGAFNAGLFSARLLIAAGDAGLREAYRRYDAGLAAAVVAKDDELRTSGADEYLRRRSDQP
jgi:5-(carboxyamino)imidazole ribonucleotide mutase